MLTNTSFYLRSCHCRNYPPPYPLTHRCRYCLDDHRPSLLSIPHIVIAIAPNRPPYQARAVATY